MEKQALLEAWAVEKQKQDEGSLQIRVITPANAQGCSDICKLPLLDNGNKIPLSTTLRQLKEMIAKHLAITIHLPYTPPFIDECNCALAKNIAAHGVWDMVRCREPTKEIEAEFSHHEDIDISKECLICSIALKEPCGSRCRDYPLAASHNECPLVINAGCEHVFHRDCYLRHRSKNCPGGCSTGEVLDLRIHSDC